MNINWTVKITNEELRRITQQKSIGNQIKRRKWNRIGHTLRKEAGAIEKTALGWNPRGYRRRGRPKRTWRRTIQDEIRSTGMERGQRDSWRSQFLETLPGCPMVHKESNDLMTNYTIEQRLLTVYGSINFNKQGRQILLKISYRTRRRIILS